MANATTKRILADGYRNAVVELIGVLDTSNATLEPAIDISADFTNNDPSAGTLNGLAICEIRYSISDQLAVQIEYDATADQPIAALAGRGKVCFPNFVTPNRAAAGYTGDIDVITTGWASGIQTYTLVIEAIKLYTQ
jgi:hypothetical protein